MFDKPRFSQRILALFSSIVLILSMVPGSAIAEEMSPEPSEETSATPRVETSNVETAMGVEGELGEAAIEPVAQPVTQPVTQPDTQSVTPTDQAKDEPVTNKTTEVTSQNTLESDDTMAEDTIDSIEASAESGTPTLSVLTHIQNDGWAKQWTPGGQVAGTTGRSLRMEAIRLRLEGQGNGGSLRSRAHVQNVGWQAWKNAGEVMGSEGSSQRIEALQVELTGTLVGKYDVWYRVHAQNYGWMAWAKNGTVAGTAGRSLRLEAIQIAIVPAGQAAPSGPAQNTNAAFVGSESIDIMPHVQNVGWTNAVGNGQTAGSVGRGLRLEAFHASLNGVRVPGNVEVRSHVQNIGWQPWSTGVSGTTGRGLRVEAIRMRLTGEAASTYDLYYRAHVQNVGWLSWAKEGESAGSTGLALRVEAIQALLVPEGASAPSNDDARYSLSVITAASIEYEAYVQGIEWQGVRGDGGIAGTVGEGRRVEGFRATIDGKETTGGISYRAHVQNSGWQSWASNGGVAGSPGSGMRVEAIQISLNGMASQVYSVWYRVHVQNIGWMGWTSNGRSAGTIGYGNRIEAVQVCLRGIGADPPGTTRDSFRDGNVFSNLQQASGSLNVTSFGGYSPSAGTLSRLVDSVIKIRQNGYSVGMIMMDLNTGKGVACNPDGIYYSASSIKGPYVASLVDSRPDLLRAEAWRIQNILTYSDNDAYTSLRGAYGPSCLYSWCMNASVRGDVATTAYTNYSARELAKLWARANQFFSGSPTGAELGSWFQSPQVSPIRAMLGGRYITRSKAGWIGMYGLSATDDAGLVYAPNGTYVMAILTNAPAQFSLLYDAILAMDAAHSEM